MLIYPDAESLACAAAERFIEIARQTIAEHGRFSAALSGGSTPRQTYALLASPSYAVQVDWRHVHLFWGDERCVPPDHPESSYRMAWQAWLAHVPIPPANLHRLRGEIEPHQAAEEYDRKLRDFFRPVTTQNPRSFDLVLLGMGADGHTASLFPGMPAIYETERWAVAQFVVKLSAWRITLTPWVFNQAAEVIFLISGAAKAETLQRVLCGPHQPEILPAQSIRPTSGRLIWLADQEAARKTH